MTSSPPTAPKVADDYVRVPRELWARVIRIISFLDTSFDKQTYDEKRKNDFDAPEDYEYCINVTANTERELSSVALDIEKLQTIAALATSPAQDGSAPRPDAGEMSAKLTEIRERAIELEARAASFRALNTELSSAEADMIAADAALFRFAVTLTERAFVLEGDREQHLHSYQQLADKAAALERENERLRVENEHASLRHNLGSGIVK